MRLLLVSDLHYTLKQFDWVHGVASEFDVVVIAGDLLDLVGVAPREAQAVVMLKYFERIQSRTRLVVSSGNHDLLSRNEFGEKTARWLLDARRFGVPVDGDAVMADDDTLITICPWWDGPRTRDMVGEQLARDAARRPARWIWVYHAPPDQSPTCWTGRKFFGDTDLVGWIEQYQPQLVLCGHVHQSPFRKGGSWVDRLGDTWVFNSGLQIGPVPTHIVVDTAVPQASWSSLDGSEQVRLDAPLERPLVRTPT
ncbi:MAG TPA: metallophosphoesterase [Candidatus Binatia bacterium]|jgi:Icc-related predicted phosphoesterase|nr:metallophosphoesterase [Candidatus Binatia bacterium]